MTSFSLYMLMTVLLGMAGVLLLFYWRRHHRSEREQVKERFSGGMSPLRMGDHVRRMALAAGSVGPVAALRRRLISDDEVTVLLSRAGIYGKQGKALYFTASALTPLVFVSLMFLVNLLQGGFRSPWLMMLMAVIAGMLLPKRLLAYVAERRHQDIVTELPLFVQTLRILFDSGLAVEQALRVISQESRRVFPHVATELERALQRAASGLDLAEELARVAEQLDIDELTDTVSILKQMIRQGGSARNSLQTLQKLLEERQLTAMQEKVTKLSAKMSIVMILFLFPALFILLAAPGFMALTKALGGLS